MPYVEGFDRDQAMILSWGDVVAPDSEARLVDALVDSLDLESPGFGSAAAEGGPRYSPRDPLKLYVWGYRRGIRSSRRLAESCRTNVEAIWMLSGLRPDFRTVADFREGHASDMGKVLHALNERLAGAVEWGFCSVDGSKVTASNPKMRNLTAHKLDDRTTWLDAHAKEYLRKLDKIDAMGEPDESDPLTRETIGANLGAGVLPHVIADDGADAHEVELPFEPAEGLDPSSTDPAEISRCLRAGVVPDACAGTVEVSEVRDVKRKVVDEPAPTPEPYGSHEEMAARAAGGCFVRDPGRNLVVCPAGETLRQKGVKKSGAIRHANKTACRRCPHRDRCYRGKQEWKEMDLAKDQLEKP